MKLAIFGIGFEFEFPAKIENQGLAGNSKPIPKITNFKRDYFDNDNDSEFTLKTKNAPFFMNFLNKYKLWQLFSEWTGPLKRESNLGPGRKFF